MSIFVIGINHKTAPLTLREKVYFACDKLPLYLQDLINRGIADEAVLLSTCNRSELYCEAPDSLAIYNWFCEQAEGISSAIYIYRDEEAVAHMMKVACGLDSMILGEAQILGQMKEAYSESCSAGTVGTVFHRLFQQVFAVAKEIRTTTSIGACPVSVASAAVHFARQQMESFSDANIAIIGAGDTAELLLRYLKTNLANPVTIINRNLERAELLADTFDGKVYVLDDIQQALAEIDIVFSVTGSAVPVLNKNSVQQIMADRVKRMTMIDIAVPRDIDPAVGEIAKVDLFCIDDLKIIIEKNRQGREHAAEKALDMITAKSRELICGHHSQDKVAHTICAYRGQIEQICRVELGKAQQQLRLGTDPSQVLDNFAKTFINKLMHAPSVQLRQAGQEGRLELLHYAKQLFAIPDVEAETL